MLFPSSILDMKINDLEYVSNIRSPDTWIFNPFDILYNSNKFVDVTEYSKLLNYINEFQKKQSKFYIFKANDDSQIRLDLVLDNYKKLNTVMDMKRFITSNEVYQDCISEIFYNLTEKDIFKKQNIENKYELFIIITELKLYNFKDQFTINLFKWTIDEFFIFIKNSKLL